MKKNLTAVKNFAKNHRNEIFAYSVGAVSLGAAYYVANIVGLTRGGICLSMTKEDAKLVAEGVSAMRYDTTYGHFIIRGLNKED